MVLLHNSTAHTLPAGEYQGSSLKLNETTKTGESRVPSKFGSTVELQLVLHSVIVPVSQQYVRVRVGRDRSERRCRFKTP